MPNTFINVPSDMADYAFGYNAAGDAIGSQSCLCWNAEAYGIKSTIKDMTHFYGC